MKIVPKTIFVYIVMIIIVWLCTTGLLYVVGII